MKEKITSVKIEPIDTPEYRMPTEIYFGRGESQKLPNIIGQLAVQRLLLVTGSHLAESNLSRSLENTGKVKKYPQAVRKSDFDSVNELTGYCITNEIDGIIAVGGGTILDSAKAAAVLAVNGGIIENYLVDKTREIQKPGLFYIAAPTTAGTGSEVTPWSVVWGDKKYSLSSADFMFPNIAVVDSALTDNCPEYITATAGIDALCQSIEAYWNVNDNPTSDAYAIKSINAILNNLSLAVNQPTALTRDNMAWGSLNGGLAFSNTATTICHAVSYPLTSHWGVSHGQATSITLPLFIEYTFPVLADQKRKTILKAMNAKDEKDAAENIRKLMRSIGLKTKLSELSISRDGIDIIVAEGFDPQRASNSPKIPTPQALREMLITIY